MLNKPHPTPMSAFGARLFNFGRAITRVAAHGTPLDIVPALQLSDLAERIARDLASAAWIQAGCSGVPVWADLRPELRARYRQLAERAIQTIDPQVRLDAAQDAARDTDEWMNGPYGGEGTAPTTIEIARESISRYEARLSTVEVARG